MSRWQALWIEVRCELAKAWRTPSFLLPTVLVPPAFYAFMVFGMQRGGGGRMAIATMATYGIFCAMAPGLFGIGTATAAERAGGWIDIRRASALPQGNLVLAKLCIAAGFTLAAALPVLVLALLAGVRLAPLQWGAMLLVDLLACALFGALGLALGLGLSPGSVAAVSNAVFLPSAVLGGLWFPVQALHPALLPLAQCLPTYHLGQLSLLAAGLLDPQSLWLHLAVAGAWWLALSALAVWVLRGWRRGASP